MRQRQMEPTCVPELHYLNSLKSVLVEYPRPGVALVTLNQPERMNSLGFDLVVSIKDALRRVSCDTSVRVVVLTGAGKEFCTVADDRSEGQAPNIEGLTRPTNALRAMELLDEMILQLRRMRQPVIAAVNGVAHCGGMCLALASDIRVAASSAKFRAAGITNGFTGSELGLSYLLPKAIGSSRAFELMLTGREVDAEEAQRIGLVSRHVSDEQLLDTCYAMAARIAVFSGPGTELTKRALWSGLDGTSLEGHIQAEGLGQLFIRLLTCNFEEAVAARAENRAPVFSDDK